MNGRRIKRRAVSALLLLLSIILTGCSAGGSSEVTAADGSYTVYYKNTDSTGLVNQTFKPQSADFEGILKEVLARFMAPEGTDALSALPSEVSINGTAIGVSDLTVDFSSEYLSLDRVSEVLLRSALVKTLVQLPGVETVRFTVDAQTLTIDGEEISAMNAESFIIPTNGAINSYQYLQIPLYFSNADGTALVSEKRSVYYSTNIILQKLVAEQIIEGPDKDSLLPVTSSSVLVRSATVRNGVCTIDFSSEINNAPSKDSPVTPETALYAFVNSICDALQDQDVTRVKFLIEGSSEERFRGEISLDQEFERNVNIIAAASSDTATGSVVVVGADAGAAAASADASAQGETEAEGSQ